MYRIGPRCPPHDVVDAAGMGQDAVAIIDGDPVMGKYATGADMISAPVVVTVQVRTH